MTAALAVESRAAASRVVLSSRAAPAARQSRGCQDCPQQTSGAWNADMFQAAHYCPALTCPQIARCAPEGPYLAVALPSPQ